MYANDSWKRCKFRDKAPRCNHWQIYCPFLNMEIVWTYFPLDEMGQCPSRQLHKLSIIYKNDRKFYYLHYVVKCRKSIQFIYNYVRIMLYKICLSQSWSRYYNYSIMWSEPPLHETYKYSLWVNTDLHAIVSKQSDKTYEVCIFCMSGCIWRSRLKQYHFFT